MHPQPHMRQCAAVLELKSFDDATRLLTGIATTPTPDRGGDIIEPLGAEFTLPLPLLWQHDQTQPIGEVLEATVTPTGIAITARIAQVDEPGALKDRLDEAYQSIKARLVKGLSIGWQPIDVQPIKGTFAIRARKWAWLELSAVTIPQNPDTKILTVKSAPPARKDRAMLTTQTTAERITALENSRAAKVAALTGLMEKANEANLTIEGSEDAAEYDGLELDVKKLDADLARLRTLESLNVAAAKPVAGAAPARHTGAIAVKAAAAEPGSTFVRHAMALLYGKGDPARAIDFAKHMWPETPDVQLLIKAAVTPGTTTDPAWAAPLVTVRNAAGEFLELLRPATILGRIPGLRRIPWNTNVPIQTGGGVYGWVGEGAMKPVTKLALGSTSLPPTKAAGIIAITVELAKLSEPSAEAIVRADMIAGIAQFLDLQFIDPAVAAVAGINPGSITNGVAGTASSGDPLEDVYTLISALSTANVPLGGVTLIMSETNAFVAGLLRDGLGNRRFPNINANGGTLEGMNVVTSNTANGWVIAVQPQYILYGDDGGVAIDVSTEASIVMDSAPTGAGAFTSLWQSNLIGLRAERFIGWKRAMLPAVQLITGAAYAPPTVTP